MKFGAECKEELCKLPLTNDCCVLSELYGSFLFCHTFSREYIRVVSTLQCVYDRIEALLNKEFRFNFTKRTEHYADIKNAHVIYEAFGYSGGQADALHINHAHLENDCCRAAFCRGAFLSGGYVSDPAKKYRLEIFTPHAFLCRETTPLMSEDGFYPKNTAREGVNSLYFSSSEEVSDFLTFIGATYSALRVINTTIEKDIRNSVNRRVNFENGNIVRTVTAATRQSEILSELKNSPVWDGLSADLRNTAQMRIDNPEASLSELSEELNIGRSALNHRLRKLQNIYETQLLK